MLCRRYVHGSLCVDYVAHAGESFNRLTTRTIPTKSQSWSAGLHTGYSTSSSRSAWPRLTSLKTLLDKRGPLLHHRKVSRTRLRHCHRNYSISSTTFQSTLRARMMILSSPIGCTTFSWLSILLLHNGGIGGTQGRCSRISASSKRTGDLRVKLLGNSPRPSPNQGMLILSAAFGLSLNTTLRQISNAVLLAVCEARCAEAPP